MKKIYQATAAASICFAVLMGNVYAEENTAPVEIQKESENEQESDSMARQFSCFQIKLDGEEYSFPASVEAKWMGECDRRGSAFSTGEKKKQPHFPKRRGTDSGLC